MFHQPGNYRTLLNMDEPLVMTYLMPAEQPLPGVNPSGSAESYYTSSDTSRSDETETSDDTQSIPAAHLTESGKPDGRKVRRKGTNLYGRPYCPGRPLSMEERHRIIELHMNGMKVNAISKALCISHGCVSKIISRYRSTGILSPASSPDQRRTRRGKKSDASPPSLPLPEYKQPPMVPYLAAPPADYGLCLQYSGPPEMLAPPHPYTTILPDNLMMNEYHAHILL